MKSVILLKNRKSPHSCLSKTIRRALKNYGGYTSVIKNTNSNKSEIYSTCINPMFNLYETNSQKLYINKTPSVLLIDDSVDKNTQLQIPKNSNIITILSEANTDAINLFKFSNNPVIGCGMGFHNTISASSIDNKNIMVCLQRSITTMSGKIIDPLEFLVKLSQNTDIYSILVTCATLLINDVDIVSGYKF